MDGGLKATIVAGNHSTLVKSIACLFPQRLRSSDLSHVKVPLKIHPSLTAFRDVVCHIF